MTIEPPVTLNRSPVGNVEKMCPEGVAYPAPYSSTPQQTIVLPDHRGHQGKTTMIHRRSASLSQQPDTPEQYMQDPAFAVASPSSVLMYEQDVSDMQKSLLSPCSNPGNLAESFGNRRHSGQLAGQSDLMGDSTYSIDDFERSFNFANIMSGLDNDYPIDTKQGTQWNSPVLDTGQAKFKAEDVMMSRNVNQGPTLAQLNEMDSSIFDDINSIITNDALNMQKGEQNDNGNSLGTTNNVTPPVLPKQEAPTQSPSVTVSRNVPIMSMDVKPENCVAGNPTPNVSFNTVQSKSNPTPPVLPVLQGRNTIEKLLKNTASAAIPTIPRFTTCTITSPTQEVPMIATTIKTEPVSPGAIYSQQQQPVFNVVNQPNCGQFIQQAPIMPTNVGPPPVNAYSVSLTPQLLLQTTLSTLDKPSLQKLLALPLPQSTSIKQESVVAEPESAGVKKRNIIKESSSTTSSKLNASGGKPQTVAGQKNAVAGRLEIDPDSSDSRGSASSFNNKWEEIKRYLELETNGDGAGPVLEEPPAKKIKIEEQDVAYNPVDDTRPCDQDFSDSDSDLDLSDTESIGSHSSFVEELLVGGKKEKRYFWQYNTQAKGPKGKRLCKTVESRDPHVLNNFEDPVFDPDINDARYKHNGRARKGDGNDITPNPYKLFQIGNQLKKLNRKIHDIAPPGEVTNPTRSKTRREKNKFASRACRLKKKAQHEANKIKLYGLDTEHSQLINVLDLIKNEISERINNGKQDNEDLTTKLDRLMKSNLSVMIAGNTPDYVNSVLEHVVNGDKSGGLHLN